MNLPVATLPSHIARCCTGYEMCQEWSTLKSFFNNRLSLFCFNLCPFILFICKHYCSNRPTQFYDHNLKVLTYSSFIFMQKCNCRSSHCGASPFVRCNYFSSYINRHWLIWLVEVLPIKFYRRMCETFNLVQDVIQFENWWQKTFFVFKIQH